MIPRPLLNTSSCAVMELIFTKCNKRQPDTFIECQFCFKENSHWQCLRFQLGNCSDCCQKLLSWRCRTVLQWWEIGEQCSIRSHKNAKPWWFLPHQVHSKLQECSIHGTFWKKIHSWTEPWPEWVTLGECLCSAVVCRNRWTRVQNKGPKPSWDKTRNPVFHLFLVRSSWLCSIQNHYKQLCHQHV